MKVHCKFILAIIIFLPAFIFAQNDYLNNNPIWRMTSVCASFSCLGPSCIENNNYNYYLNGDTTMNGHIYKKLFRKGTISFSWFAGPPVPTCCQGSYIFHDNLNPDAFLRDTLNKMYIVDGFGSSDTLLYDFNLAVGDSLPLTYNNYDPTITVIAIDSVQISNSYRKRFELSGNAIPHYLIEGIGHENGLLETMGIHLECGWNLVCYGLGDTAYYPSFGSGCDNAVGLIEQERFISTIDVFPNPFDNQLNFILKENEQSEIIFYDIFLRVIFHKTATGKMSFNTAMLPKGIYFYEARDRNHIIGKGKVVKN